MYAFKLLDVVVLNVHFPGVEIASTSVSVPTGYVQEGESNSVDFSVSITSDSDAGAAVGTGLWQVTAFASSNSDGSGTRYDEQPITLSDSQASTTLDPGTTAVINDLSYDLDLQDGPTCSEVIYICTEVEKGTGASPDFELTPAVTTSCTAIDCRGK